MNISLMCSGIYGPKGVTVPDPIQSVCTRWGSDPFCSGSYSHIRVGSSGADYDILAESINEQVFFAGEATNRAYPATMHGALLSGLREASKILRAAEGRADSDHKKYSLQKSLRTPNGVLEDLFMEPDLAFGRFSFVFSSVTPDDPQAPGLARISLDKCLFLPLKDHESKEDQKDQAPAAKKVDCEIFYLYATITREQADRIRLSSNDDKSRLALLCKDLGVKLMGYDCACDEGSDLISGILSAQKARKRLQRPKNLKISH
jgi:[histone H3]-N6,N6-dimethyl-L-lysine4 FAD-dependent demethylase